MRNGVAVQYAFRRACDQIESGADLTIEHIQGFFSDFAMAVERARKDKEPRVFGHVDEVSAEAKSAIQRGAR